MKIVTSKVQCSLNDTSLGMAMNMLIAESAGRKMFCVVVASFELRHMCSLIRNKARKAHYLGEPEVLYINRDSKEGADPHAWDVIAFDFDTLTPFAQFEGRPIN